METIVVSVGGSIIVPSGIDYNFLVSLRKTAVEISKKHKLVICTGGGHTAREYISILRKAGADNHTQDIAGIDATRLNARLVASFISAGKKAKCSTEVPKSLEEIGHLLKANNIVVCGGLGPGKTSDGTTADIARFLKAKAMYNLTNVKGLFDKDPSVTKKAKFISNISREDFRKVMAMVHEKPGQHFVLDSYAEKIAREAKIRVVILKGMNNLLKAVEGKRFVGTIIE